MGIRVSTTHNASQYVCDLYPILDCMIRWSEYYAGTESSLRRKRQGKKHANDYLTEIRKGSWRKWSYYAIMLQGGNTISV